MKLKGFIRSLKALEPRLGEIVIAGGWCWYLYRKYLTAETTLSGEFTLDVDLVLPRAFRTDGKSFDEMLGQDDFERIMEGDERPPVTKYCWPSAEAPEAIVEFLTPAAGEGSDATIQIGGIVAQQLRFLNLLLDEPFWLKIDEVEEREQFDGRVRLPGVGHFVLQKALTFQRRGLRSKRFKDLFYIFDLFDASRGLQSRIEADLRSCEGSRRAAWVRKAAEALEEVCGSPDSDAIGRISEQVPEEDRPSRSYIAETLSRLIQTMRDSQGRPGSEN